MLETNLCGIKLDNPLLPGSGPLTGSYEKMKFFADEGLGAIVTKTIAPEAADVLRPCIIGGRDIIMNCESWSEYSLEKWADEFLPEYRKNCKTPILASMGYNEKDTAKIVPLVDKYVDGYELSFRYTYNDYEETARMVGETKKLTDKPLWIKTNDTALANPEKYAKECYAAGVDGIVAGTSIGPNLAVDLSKRRAKIGTDSGYVWTSGPVIKPQILALVNRIKNACPDLSIISSGGVQNAEDVLEYILAGADAVEMLSAAMIHGRTLYGKIIKELPATLEKYGFSSIQEVRDTSLKPMEVRTTPLYPQIDYNLCSKCKICSDNCPYFAMDYNGKPIVNIDKCFGCGLCESRCPKKAISGCIS